MTVGQENYKLARRQLEAKRNEHREYDLGRLERAWPIFAAPLTLLFSALGAPLALDQNAYGKKRRANESA